MTLPYTALITVDELKRATLDSFGSSIQSALEDDASDIYEAAVDIITDVTATIERALSRQLIVRRQTLRFAAGHYGASLTRFDRMYDHPIAGDWHIEDGYVSDASLADGSADFLLLAFARQWPVVQVVSVDGDEDLAGQMTIQDDGRRLSLVETSFFQASATDILPRQIDVFAGYRRRDQDITPGSGSGDDVPSDLNVETGLAGLELNPPLLPGDIRRCAIRLAVYEFRNEIQGLTGIDRLSKRIDQMTVDSTRLTEDFQAKELEKLTDHRYFGI